MDRTNAKRPAGRGKICATLKRETAFSSAELVEDVHDDVVAHAGGHDAEAVPVRQFQPLVERPLSGAGVSRETASLAWLTLWVDRRTTGVCLSTE